MAFHRGELIWLDFNPQSGREQAGRRPALVISPEEYNSVSSCVLVCPITANQSPWPWKVALPAHCPIKGAVLVDQLKSADSLARHAESAAATVDAETLNEILSRLQTLVG